MQPLGAWVAARHETARFVLERHDLFSSAAGVGFNDEFNEARRGTVLASDPPEHDQLRRVLSEQLAPRNLRHLRTDIERQAEELVAEMVHRRSFDGVKDFAARFPLSIVADLIGVSNAGRDRLLDWADGAFNTFGPMNARTIALAQRFLELRTYMAEFAARENLLPGSMGHAVYAAVDRGEIDPGQALPLMAAYLTAGMDTTINSISNALWLFGLFPHEWEKLRRGELSPAAAFNEVLRFESPVYVFARTATRDVAFGQVTVPEGSRVAVLYGSANRNERMVSRGVV